MAEKREITNVQLGSVIKPSMGIFTYFRPPDYPKINLETRDIIESLGNDGEYNIVANGQTVYGLLTEYYTDLNSNNFSKETLDKNAREINSFIDRNFAGQIDKMYTYAEMNTIIAQKMCKYIQSVLKAYYTDATNKNGIKQRFKNYFDKIDDVTFNVDTFELITDQFLSDDYIFRYFGINPRYFIIDKPQIHVLPELYRHFNDKLKQILYLINYGVATSDKNYKKKYLKYKQKYLQSKNDLQINK
jgi:hypothetical protein